MEIRVPATSANLGPGFDSIGIAVNRYLTVKVEGPTEKWQVKHKFGSEVPTDESNLVVKSALALAPECAPQRLSISSEIPLARGLGSSSSAILAGLALGNELGGLNLNKQEVLQLAATLEGHPDNVAPALFGDCMVAAMVDNQCLAVQLPFPDVHLVAFVPDSELLTKESRQVLPTELSYKNSIQGSSIANLLVAGIGANQLPIIKAAIQRDIFHEPYRQKLVPELIRIRERLAEMPTGGTYLSGAGPTVITLVAPENESQVRAALSELALPGEIITLLIDRKGLQIRRD